MQCCIKPLPLVDLDNDEDIVPLEVDFESESEIFDKNDDITSIIINKDKNLDRYNSARILYSKYIGYQYVSKYYRINYTWKQCLYSLFFIHNETVNIWTHLLSALGAVCLMIYKNLNPSKLRWVSNLVLFGSILIYLASTFCHLFSPMSKTIKQNQYLFMVDFVGIMIGVIIFEITFFYLLLINQTKSFQIISSLCCIFNTIPIIMRGIITCKNNILIKSNIIYCILVLINVLLFIISFCLTKSHFMLRADVILPFLLSNLFLIGSLFINLIYNYPEKKCPGHCDLCGASHQIWHVIVSAYLFSIYYQIEYWETLV
jgi:adiponectin receptor